MYKILVIVPAYNEEENIDKVIEGLTSSLAKSDEMLIEYILINDGSSDNTKEKCIKNKYNSIHLPVNLGLSGAFQTGMQYALKHEYDAALQFDADGQHQAEYIGKMVETMQETQSDVVIGSRFVTEKKPFTMRMMGSFLISFAIRLTTGTKLTDPTSGMRLYNKTMIKEFAQGINHQPEPDTISYLLKRGARVKEIQVHMEERMAGKSYLNFGNSIRYMLRMAVSIMLVQWFRGGELLHTERGER